MLGRFGTDVIQAVFSLPEFALNGDSLAVFFTALGLQPFNLFAIFVGDHRVAGPVLVAAVCIHGARIREQTASAMTSAAVSGCLVGGKGRGQVVIIVIFLFPPTP